MNYHISNAHWAIVFSYLTQQAYLHTSNESQLRLFIEAIYFMTRTGCQWRLLPEKYGYWRAIHRRYKRWSDKGIWKDLMAFVGDPDDQEFMIDSTIVRAHACSAGYKKNDEENLALGRSKGGFTTKIHALVDGLGNPIKFLLTPGQRHDITQAAILTEEIHDSAILGDKGYDADHFIDWLNKNNNSHTIPPKRNRKNPRDYDQHRYKERHLVECFFSKMKHFRRVFSRFDKSVNSFLGFLYFVGTLIWLR